MDLRDLLFAVRGGRDDLLGSKGVSGSRDQKGRVVVQSKQLTLHLIKNDLRLIRRDQTLVSMAGFAFLIAIVLRFLLPWLNDYLAERGVLPNESVATSLADVFPMLVTFFALFNGAQLSGAIFGFLLLDEKDQHTITVVQVSPVSMRQFLICRVLLPTLLGFVFCTGMVLIINQAVLPVWQVVLICASASLLSPIMALFLANCAENKVQGFAIAKFTGISGWTILFGWFVSEPAQWLLGLFPPFLVSKSYWMALDGEQGWWAVLSLSFALQVFVVVWLAKRFQRVVAT